MDYLVGDLNSHWEAWSAVVASSVFHGVNPAMGWLFATALGLQRGSRSALLLALSPIALGHAASVLLFTSSIALLGAWTPPLATTAAIALLAYEYLGLGILKRGWINFEWLWQGTLGPPARG